LSIEKVLQGYILNHRVRLNKPASESQLKKVKALFPEFPEELISMLKMFNGEIGQMYPINHVAFVMSTQEIEEHYDMFIALEGAEPNINAEYPLQVKSVLYDKAWIPVFHYNGDVYFVDMSPTDKGVKGQVVFINVAEGCDLVELKANSIYEYFNQNPATT